MLLALSPRPGWRILSRVARVAGARRARSAPPSLDLWHAAVSRLPPLAVDSADVRLAAFFGDKVLSAAVAEALRRGGGAAECANGRFDAGDLGSVAETHAIAVSNRLLGLRFGEILPARAALDSHRRAGTIVEATVSAVHRADRGGERGAAVAALARWLVVCARDSTARIDAKNRLLALGGTVAASAVPGSPDHRPVFEAVAELGRERAVAAAATKRDAETSASLDVLSLCQKRAVPVAPEAA